MSNGSVNSAKRPAPLRAEIVDAGNPERLHRLGLQLRVAAAKALGFEDQVQRLVAAVVDADDEVRESSGAPSRRRDREPRN